MKLQIIFIGLVLVLGATAFSQTPDTSYIFIGDTVRVSAEKEKPVANFSSIAAKMFIPLQKTPISIGVVPQKVLQDQHVTGLSDALKNISSVNVQSALGTHDYFLIRGFESTSAGLVLADGVSEPDVSLFRFFGFGYYDLYNIDQVEVLKGPAAFLYGGNTLSGAVNMQRKQPVFRNFVNISASRGKFNHYRGCVDMGVTNSSNNLALRLNSLTLDTDFYRHEKNNEIQALNPALIWRINKSSALNVNFEYINGRLMPDTGIPLYLFEGRWQLPDVPRQVSYQRPDDFLKLKTGRLRIDYHNQARPWLLIRNKSYFSFLNGSTSFSLPHIPYRNIVGTWLVDRHKYGFDESQENFGNQTEAVLQLRNGNIKHHLLLGIEAGKLSNHSARNMIQIDGLYLFHPEISLQDRLIVDLNKIKTQVNSTTIAHYFVDHIEFSEKVQAFCGGRMDVFEFSTDRQNSPFDFIGRELTSRPVPLTKNYQKFSPMVGLIVKDSETLRFYANMAQSFAQGLRVVDEPEKSTQLEIGYKYMTRDGRFRNWVAIYNIRKDNMSIPLQGPLQGDRHEPSGSQQSRGFELEIIAQPGLNWYTYFTYSYTEAELVKYQIMDINEDLKTQLRDYSGNIPPFVPAHLLNIWTGKEFRPGCGLGFGIQYVSQQYIHADNNFEIDGFVMYNLALYFRIRDLSFRIDGKNLTGQTWLTRGLGPYSVIPANSRTFYGTCEFFF